MKKYYQHIKHTQKTLHNFVKNCIELTDEGHLDSATSKMQTLFAMLASDAKSILQKEVNWEIKPGNMLCVTSKEEISAKLTRKIKSLASLYKNSQGRAIKELADIFPSITVDDALGILKKERVWNVDEKGVLHIEIHMGDLIANIRHTASVEKETATPVGIIDCKTGKIIQFD